MDIRECCVDYKWWESCDKQRLTAVFEEENIAICLIVCPVCEGKGKYVNPSIDSHGINNQEFLEDPDFADSYFQGVYDVTCGLCNGDNVVPEPAECEMQKKVARWRREQSYYRSEVEAERRMGC